MWNSPIPEKRWRGFRASDKGADAFASLEKFENATLSELQSSLEEHEAATLGRLIARGKSLEIEVFIRTHNPNPIIEPHGSIDVEVGVAKADVIDLHELPTAEANRAILDGEVLHVLFQAGEASRFAEGPLYNLNPISVSQKQPEEAELSFYLKGIAAARADIPKGAGDFLYDAGLGPRQPVMIRAALRRVIRWEIEAGRLNKTEALERYQQALSKQKILFFVSRRGDVSQLHDNALRNQYKFYGFNPSNLVTIEQELARGLTINEQGHLSFMEGDRFLDAAGHFYALMQAVRTGGFTTYTESGRPIKPMETDAFSYLMSLGAKILNVIRINDMDRHSTEIINPKAVAYALKIFEAGYVNAIETVANPTGQKGGTGTTFGDSEIHVLTETHENSFPALSRAFDAAVQAYLQESKGRHPAYNAMRQLADLGATRRVLREFGGRIVFVPRMKKMGQEEVFYLGADMPMGDLSLLFGNYKSRMFQFAGPHGHELLIHDMKKKENLPIALRAIQRQMEDPDVIAAAGELDGPPAPFSTEKIAAEPLYGTPCPEFENPA